MDSLTRIRSRDQRRLRADQRFRLDPAVKQTDAARTNRPTMTPAVADAAPGSAGDMGAGQVDEAVEEQAA